MKINLKQLSETAVESTAGSRKMRLSENTQGMVFMLFTKKVYSNPIGTVVREITSNCFDSHVEAGVNSPVIIKKGYDKENSQHYISFIDFGVGMSPERIYDIYGVYFESTKRVDNTQIGGYGIGGKTPLAYKRYTGVGQDEYDNSFFVITTYNGTKYYYCIYEGEDSPVIAELHREATSEHNGTEVRVPILEKDLQSFEMEMVKQLYYFENIIFEGFDSCNNSYETTLTNQYQIIRGKHFLFRGTKYSGHMHVCLGRVAYPIDYSVLGLSSGDYNIPFALRLENGALSVTVSREQLDYNEQTISTIKAKLAEAKAEIIALLTKQYDNIVSLEEYFEVKNEFGYLNLANGERIHIGNMINPSDIDFSNFHYNFMKMPSDGKLFKFFFEVKDYGKKTRKNRYSDYSSIDNYKALKSHSNLLYIEDGFNRNVLKQAYLKDEFTTYHIIEKRNIASMDMRSEIADIFNVHLDTTVDDNGKPVAFVRSLLDMQEEYMTIVRKHAQNYDTLEVPEEFIQSRKNRRGMSKELRDTTIPVKYFGTYGKHRTKLNDLFNYDMPIFYGVQEDEFNLENAYRLFCLLFDKRAVAHYDTYDNCFETDYSGSYNTKAKENSIMFIMVSSANVKYLKYCKKAYHVNEFKIRMLYRKESIILNYFKTYALKNAWGNVRSPFTSDSFAKVNAAWGKKIREINTFIRTLPDDNDKFNSLKDVIRRYYDIDNLQQTTEQKRIAELIEEVKNLEAKNENYLCYIYDKSNLDSPIIVDILQKLMVF